MAKELVYNATLVEREDLTSALAVFRIRPDEALPGEGSWFVPGQYLTIGLNNLEKPELGSVRRPMSIASAPERRDLVEFYIRFVEKPESDNPLTHLLWKTRAGDRMFLRSQPVGKFTVEDTMGHDARLKVCVAAGTGLAPFLSMVRSKVNQDPKVRLDDWAIIHGASYSKDLGYRDELDSLVKHHGLRYLPTVSRPREEANWTGHVGRAEDFFRADRLAGLEDSLGLDRNTFRPDRVGILICGLQGTIGATIERLLHRGFVPDNRKIRRALEIPEDMPAHTFYEAYDTIPPIDLNDVPRVAELKSTFHGSLPSRS
jgi:ferredoxin--NADP+ reductase